MQWLLNTVLTLSFKSYRLPTIDPCRWNGGLPFAGRRRVSPRVAARQAPTHKRVVRADTPGGLPAFVAARMLEDDVKAHEDEA